MSILSSEQMRQIEAQLLKLPLPPNLQLKIPKMPSSQVLPPTNTSILFPASESLQLDIRKVVSLADNMRCLSLSDSNATLRVFTMAVLSIIYQGRMQRSDGADGLLLQALRCSLYSPAIALNSIKGVPLNCSSNQMKALLACFFELLASQGQNLGVDGWRVAEVMLQQNEGILQCFVLFFRCILVILEVEGAGCWKGSMNERGCLEHLLDYFDLSYRKVADLFLLYEQGVFLSIREKEVVLGEYFQNQGEREHEQKQLQIKSSIKMNMIESYLLNVNNQEKRKKGIVDSDLKLFNFMLDSCEEEVKSHPDTETPHFKDNQVFHFGRKKKEDPVAYRPQQVRFQFEKLIKDESLQEIQPDDLINFNAQFEDAPSLPQFNLAKELDSPTSLDERAHSRKTSLHPNLIAVPKNRMSLAEHQPGPSHYASTPPLPQNREKKAATEINADLHAHSLGPNSKSHYQHPPLPYPNLQACFCREVRLSRNTCTSKVVDFSFIPSTRKSPVSPLPTKNMSFKNARTVTEPKSYTLNKQSAKEKKWQLGEERTPAFLKKMKKMNTLKEQGSTSPPREQTYPSSAQEIGRDRSSNNQQGQRSSTFLGGRRQQGVIKMKVSDNQQQQPSTKKFQLFNTSNRGVMGQSSNNWQTSSNFHQRHPTSASPLNQTKSTFLPQPPQKNTSPLKFFAPVQIIAPTVYLNSNGAESNNNIVLKLSQLHQNSPKLIRGQHQSPYANKYNPASNETLHQIL